MSSIELWAFAAQKGLTKRLPTAGKTPWHSLGAYMYVETKENASSDIVRVGRRPVRFWLKFRPLPDGWTPSGPGDESRHPPATASGTEAKEKAWLEKDLHPLLADFARTRLDGVRVKTIRHTTSTKKSFGEWVHPDMIGARFPMSALDERVTIEFASAVRAPLLRLFSFELKRSVDFGNLREVFFQAVSNSSWAHEAYLVAAHWRVDEDEFMDELARLCQSFGIGAIQLNLEDPTQSKIVLQATPRQELDWATLDKLVAMNPDVAQFLETVRIDLNANKIHEAEYDQPPKDSEEYARSLLNRGSSKPKKG
jgi:hypothetical protein